MIYIPKLKFGNLRTLEAFLKTLEFDFCSIKIEDLEKIDQGTLADYGFLSSLCILWTVFLLEIVLLS